MTSAQWRNLALLALADAGEVNSVDGALRVVDQGALIDDGRPAINRDVYRSLVDLGLAQEAWVDQGHETWCRITGQGRATVAADDRRFRKAAKAYRRKAR